MCRLFGFRSIINSHIHSSLVSAENTLYDLSQNHPDGWGVAYYMEQTPHLVKSTNCAMDDQIFQKVSGGVSSHTVIAHIRKATQGAHSILNSHPFQYGKWIFAHNGNVKNLKKIKPKLLKLVDHQFTKLILGSTDSEIIFYIILSKLKKVHPLVNAEVNSQDLIKVIKESITAIIKVIGDLSHNNTPVNTENYLSFILSSGPVMVAFNGGQDLYNCTYKTQCPEKGTCKSYAPYCEAAPDTSNKVNHLIFSSEMISGQNVWIRMKPGEIVGVDKNMKYFKDSMDIKF